MPSLLPNVDSDEKVCKQIEESKKNEQCDTVVTESFYNLYIQMTLHFQIVLRLRIKSSSHAFFLGWTVCGANDGPLHQYFTSLVETSFLPSVCRCFTYHCNTLYERQASNGRQRANAKPYNNESLKRYKQARPLNSMDNLVVKEWQSSDQMVESIEARLDKVLTVVTEEFEGGKHGQTSI